MLKTGLSAPQPSSSKSSHPVAAAATEVVAGCVTGFVVVVVVAAACCWGALAAPRCIGVRAALGAAEAGSGAAVEGEAEAEAGECAELATGFESTDCCGVVSPATFFASEDRIDQPACGCCCWPCCAACWLWGRACCVALNSETAVSAFSTIALRHRIASSRTPRSGSKRRGATAGMTDFAATSPPKYSFVRSSATRPEIRAGGNESFNARVNAGTSTFGRVCGCNKMLLLRNS